MSRERSEVGRLEPVQDIIVEGFVPELSLTSNRREWWNIKTHLRRRNIVLFFMHDLNCEFCRGFLQALGDNEPVWRRLRTEVAAVVPGPGEKLTELARETGSPYPLLSDTEGRAREAFSFESVRKAVPPFVFAVDRFATLYFHDLDETADARAQERDVFGEISFLESQCPECGVYRWSRPEAG